MSNPIQKRLQVFISSTYKDLIEERQAAVEAILTLGHIPAGMELFTAGDESQLDVIKQWINESDVYLLILGGRYGSIEPNTRKSYTQLEYEYALNIGKPLFACVVEETAQENRLKNHGSSVTETAEPHKLKDFRELVMRKMVRPWEDKKDIKISVGETLSHFARNNNLIGWVRADQQVNVPALADEIARLSKENARVSEENAQLCKANQESGFIKYYPRHTDYNFSDLIISSDSLTLILNDGLSWIKYYAGDLRHRFEKTNTTTTLYQLDPNGDFIPAISSKVDSTQDDYKKKLDNAKNEIIKLHEQGSKNGTLEIFRLKTFPTQTIFLTEEKLIITPYAIAAKRGNVPVLVYDSTNSNKGMCKIIKEDLENLKTESTKVY